MMMNPPSKVWIQWYGEDDGNDIGFDRPEGPTFNTEKVYQNDVCYIRAGKPSPIIGNLQIELRAARFAAEAAERERDALAAEVERLSRLLTVGEQEEIIGYIRDRIAGNPIDLDDIPIWLADLERTRQENTALRTQLATGEWRSVALALGESWGSNGPEGYYDMTPAQWLEWMNETLIQREWDAL